MVSRVKTETVLLRGRGVTRAVLRVTQNLDSALASSAALARGAALFLPLPSHLPSSARRDAAGRCTDASASSAQRTQLTPESDLPVTTIAFAAGLRDARGLARLPEGLACCFALDFSKVARDPGACVPPPRTDLAARSGVHFEKDTKIPRIRFREGEIAMNVTLENSARSPAWPPSST